MSTAFPVLDDSMLASLDANGDRILDAAAISSLLEARSRWLTAARPVIHWSWAIGEFSNGGAFPAKAGSAPIEYEVARAIIPSTGASSRRVVVWVYGALDSGSPARFGLRARLLANPANLAGPWCDCTGELVVDGVIGYSWRSAVFEVPDAVAWAPAEFSLYFTSFVDGVNPAFGVFVEAWSLQSDGVQWTRPVSKWGAHLRRETAPSDDVATLRSIRNLQTEAAELPRVLAHHSKLVAQLGPSRLVRYIVPCPPTTMPLRLFVRYSGDGGSIFVELRSTSSGDTLVTSSPLTVSAATDPTWTTDPLSITPPEPVIAEVVAGVSSTSVLYLSSVSGIAAGETLTIGREKGVVESVDTGDQTISISPPLQSVPAVGSMVRRAYYELVVRSPGLSDPVRVVYIHAVYGPQEEAPDGAFVTGVPGWRTLPDTSRGASQGLPIVNNFSGALGSDAIDPAPTRQNTWFSRFSTLNNAAFWLQVCATTTIPLDFSVAPPTIGESLPWTNDAQKGPYFRRFGRRRLVAMANFSAELGGLSGNGAVALRSRLFTDGSAFEGPPRYPVLNGHVSSSAVDYARTVYPLVSDRGWVWPTAEWISPESPFEEEQLFANLTAMCLWEAAVPEAANLVHYRAAIAPDLTGYASIPSSITCPSDRPFAVAYVRARVALTHPDPSKLSISIAHGGEMVELASEGSLASVGALSEGVLSFSDAYEDDRVPTGSTKLKVFRTSSLLPARASEGLWTLTVTDHSTPSPLTTWTLHAWELEIW